MLYLAGFFCLAAVAGAVGHGVIGVVDVVDVVGVVGGVRGGGGVWVGVLMNSVQQPQEELQSIMLGVPSELGAVLGHDALQMRTNRASLTDSQLH